MSPPIQAAEQPLGTALRRSGGDYLIGAAGSYLALALSLWLTILLTRLLGAEGYGQAALLLTTAQAVTFFATFWTTAGLVRFGTEAWMAEGTYARVLWGRNLMIAVPLAALLLGAWWGGRGWLQRLGLPADSLGAVLAYALGLVLFQTSQFTFQALKRLRAFAVWQVAEKAALCTAVWWCAARLRGELAWLVWLYAAASVAVGLASLLTLPRAHYWPMRTDRATIRRLTKFSWPLLLSLVCGYLSTNWIDLLIIRRYASLASVGHYNLAYQIMGVVQMLPTLSFPVTLPLLVGWQVTGRGEGVQLYASRLVPHAYVALAGLLAVAMALVRPVVLAVFGTAFAPAVVPCGWLLLAVAWYGLFISGMPLLNLWERTGVILAASAAAGAVNIVGDLALVPRWGITGAAMATVAAYATSAVMVMAAIRRRAAIPVCPIGFSLAAVTAAFIGCVGLSGPLGSGLGVGGALLGMGAAVGAGRLFSRADWHWLRDQYLHERIAAAKAL